MEKRVTAHDDEHAGQHGSFRQLMTMFCVFFALSYVGVAIIMYFEYPDVQARMDRYYAETVATLRAALR